jgi:hypothetical protein
MIMTKIKLFQKFYFFSLIAYRRCKIQSYVEISVQVLIINSYGGGRAGQPVRLTGLKPGRPKIG